MSVWKCWLLEVTGCSHQREEADNNQTVGQDFSQAVWTSVASSSFRQIEVILKSKAEVSARDRRQLGKRESLEGFSALHGIGPRTNHGASEVYGREMMAEKVGANIF